MGETDTPVHDAAAETIAYENARLDIRFGLATFVIDNPASRNALSPPMVEALYAALIEIAKPRRRIRCLMITGEGKAFCAGANIATGAASAVRTRAEPAAIASVSGTFHPLLRRVRDLEIPVVAAVNGACVGFGLALTLLADYVVASDTAFFLVPFRNLASCTDSGLTWLLPRTIGMARARQMVIRAERVSAATALDWGMINQMVPESELRAAAASVAEEFASGPTIALGIMRRLLLDGFDRTLDTQLEAETRGVARTSRTKDNNAALRLFGAKEKPTFIGE